MFIECTESYLLLLQVCFYSVFSYLALSHVRFNGLKIIKKMFQILCFNTNLIFIHFLNLFILRHAKWGSRRQKEWCLALYICILDNINMCSYLL